MSAEAVVEAEQSLLECAQPRDAGLEANPGADVAEVADVVVEALELGQEQPAPAGSGRDCRLGQGLNGHRAGQGMADRADAAGPFN